MLAKPDVVERLPRIEGLGLAHLAARGLGVPRCVVRNSEVITKRGNVRVEPNRPLEQRHGGRVVAEAAFHDAEVDEDVGVLGVVLAQLQEGLPGPSQRPQADGELLRILLGEALGGDRAQPRRPRDPALGLRDQPDVTDAVVGIRKRRVEAVPPTLPTV